MYPAYLQVTDIAGLIKGASEGGGWIAIAKPGALCAQVTVDSHSCTYNIITSVIPPRVYVSRSFNL